MDNLSEVVKDSANLMRKLGKLQNDIEQNATVIIEGREYGRDESDHLTHLTRIIMASQDLTDKLTAIHRKSYIFLHGFAPEGPRPE